MSEKTLIPLLVLLVILAVVIPQIMFIVDQREQAIVLQLGQPVGEPRGPGLHFKMPFVQEARFFDRRVLSVDPGAEQMVIASASIMSPEEKGDASADDFSIKEVSGEPIIVDTFARYRITDPLQFLKTLRTIANANSRLEDILNESTKAVLGNTTLEELLSIERQNVMTNILERVNKKTESDQLGIEIVDVRIVRADLTSELRTSTVRRMISELKERATETRARGEERALEIRSTADKERTVLIAEASRDSEIMKGQGDKEAIKIYAAAFNKDKEFYGFLRSMEAYSNTLSDPNTRLVLSPESGFFKYFQNRTGR